MEVQRRLRGTNPTPFSTVRKILNRLPVGQVARELVPEVRARDGREGDVARGYKSDYFVGLIRTFKTAIILFDSHKSR
jgi:hypothetical protein